MQWRKLIAVLAVSVVGLGMLAGCGAKPEPPEQEPPAAEQPKADTPAPAPTPEPAKKVELEFWGWWASATRMPTIEKIVGEWNAKNPNIQVKYVFVPFGEIETKYLASVAAGNPPDVVAVPNIFATPMRAGKRQNTDLSTVGALDVKDQYYEHMWNAILYQGKPYGLPWVGETKYLYYNKDHFAEVGLDPEKGPVSWDDLKAFADKLDKKEGSRLVRAGFHPMFGNFGFHGWVWNAGGSFFDNRSWPTANTDKNVEVMAWMQEWTDRYGKENYAAFLASGGGPNHPFATGRVSMIVETATWEGELKKNAPDVKYGIMAIPTPDGKQHGQSSYTGGFAIEVPAGVKNPKEAFEFAKYWTQEGAVVWGKEQNDFPATKLAGTIDTPEFKRMVENMQYTGLIPVPSFAPSYLDAITVAVEDVMMGNKDPKQALDDAQGAIIKMVQENTN